MRDLRDIRAPLAADEIAAFETDVFAGFVLARAAAGLTDATIRSDVNHLELVRDWFEAPLWEMQPPDADAYFGKVLREARPATRAARAGALTVYFEFLELRHKVEIYNLTGRVVECPLDEINRPRASVEPLLRVPPTEVEIEELFGGWREDLATCRKFAPAARNYTAARLAADVGLRINETRMLDLDDVRWELGRFGKLNVRFGKGARRRGPKQRLVSLINGSDQVLRWFIEDVWGHFGVDHTLPGVPLFPSERKMADGSGGRVSTEVFRRGLAEAVDDVDLPNRRITLAGSPQRLGDLAVRTLTAWLTHRRVTWPNTPNRHVLISEKTALDTTPVTRGDLKWNLLRHGVPLDRIRRDCILHEALTVGPDPLHLSLVFGLSHTAASHYATIARKILEEEPTAPSGS